MTRLYNRSEIQRRISVCTEDSSPENISVIMLDLDDFKTINDTFGHKEGDLVIRTIADLMRKHISAIQDASAGRWGGEEFMILLPNRTEKEAFELAEEISQSFAGVVFPQAGYRTVSLGVAQRIISENGDSLVQRADQALYEAKKQGKNRTVCAGNPAGI